MSTTPLDVTEKQIASFEARRHFGELIDGVKSGDKFLITEHGKQVAAVVPLKIYEGWKKERQTFFDQVRDISKQVNLSPEKADRLAAEAVNAVRTAK